MRDELDSPISLSYCCIMQCLLHCEMASFSAACDSKSNGGFMDFLLRGYEDFDVNFHRWGVEKRDNFPQLLRVFVVAVGLLYAAAAQSLESEIDHLVQILQIKPGSTVADVGAGSGEITMAIAKQLGMRSRVYSTEVDPKLVDQIRRLAESERITNVIPIAGKPDNTELPNACCDAIFLRRVYHHLTDPLDMDHSLYQALRPDGRLAIIDFEPSQLPGRPAPPGVPRNRGGHGVPQKIVEEELTRAGSVLLKTIPWPMSPDLEHYCMLFVKPLSPGGGHSGGP